MSDGLRIGLIVGGAVAVAVAIVWQVVRLRRARSGRGLDASDAQERARAGVALADQGLKRSARRLLHHIAHEPDERVRYAIALAVARRDFEPVGTKRVRRLRGWAASEIEQHGGAAAEGGRPEGAAGEGAAPPPATDEPSEGRADAAAPLEEGVQWHAPDDGGSAATS